MKIHSVKYQEKRWEWEYSTVHFSDLTLLVGISGVGKTQILTSLMNLKKIALGDSSNRSGVSWEISFSNNGADYLWIGEFEIQDLEVSWKMDKIKDPPKLIKEIVQLNGKEIATRNEGEIFFGNKIMPKLSPTQSLISIFKEEEGIKKAFEGFKKITLRDYTKQEDVTSKRFSFLNGNNISDTKAQYQTLEDIRESNLKLIVKLYYLHENQDNIFNVIKDRFIDIFPQIEDVNIKIDEGHVSNNLGKFEFIVLYIKEKGVNRWIPHTSFSSGMLRTFLHLSEIYLLKKGSVVLIDEFENSLGTNCINALAEDLMFENNDIQFIITSHHPYIINQIPYEYWKIVTRENGKIVTYNADEFNLGESHHERFMNLINLPTYKKGIVHA